METGWGARSVNNKPEEYSSSTERQARSIALEKAYVHDVYSQIASHFSDSRYRAWPKVKQFLLDLEPGSVVCDVGCGNGKYLDINPSIHKIGIDRCLNLTGAAREKNHEVLVSDNLNIPFRDDCFDAVISIAVIHHFATTERRIAALQELARVLRIGGRLIVSVWAMEQRHRRFESQDVLVPWNRPIHSSSDDKTSSIERDLNSTTTTTSDDDAATHYHAYTQTSDSDHSFASGSLGGRKRGRIRHRGRSIDPTCPSSSQSSSDLSSPNESCYSFVRRALQKLAGNRRNRTRGRPWFLQGLDIPVGDDDDQFGSLEEDAPDGLDFRNNLSNNNFMPIELRHLESTDFAELFQLGDERMRGSKTKPGMLLANVLYPRRRTLETTCELQGPTGSIAAQPKSKSLSDLFGLLPVGLLRSKKSTEEVPVEPPVPKNINLDDAAASRSNSSLSVPFPSNDELMVEFPDFVRHKAVQTDMSIETASSSGVLHNQDSLDSSGGNGNGRRYRPVLVKQKQSISPSASASADEGGPPIIVQEVPATRTSTSSAEEEGGDTFCWGEMKRSVRDLPELRRPSNANNTLQVPSRNVGGLSSFWKQSSLNEELIFSERLKEKQILKQNIQKQCSLNEDLIYKRREHTRWDQMKEAFLNSPNFKCSLQLLRDGISSRLRGGDSPSPQGEGAKEERTSSSGGINGESLSPNNTGSSSGGSPSPTQQRPYTAPSSSSSIRNGIVRILQNWKQGDSSDPSCGGGPSSPSAISGQAGTNGSFTSSFGVRRGSKEGTQRRGLFPPFFLRRSSAGSLNLNKDAMANAKVLSPPHLKRRPSENELIHEQNGNKLLPGVRHIRKLSREEGSDSSKDSSFQSDTSVDSEDSFASVIFIPNKGIDGADSFTFGMETRANSTDSESRSPKSPASRLSPPNHNNLPKSPSPLASELLRRRSPEVSPTKGGVSGLYSQREVTKFVFDENTTSRLLSPGGGNNGSSSSRSPVEEGTHSVTLPLSPLAVSVVVPAQLPLESSSAEIKEIEKVQTPIKEDVEKIVETAETESPSAPLIPPPPKKKVEKIEVLRKPGILPEGNKVTRSLVRRSFPKSFAVELYNPETEDADTSESSSSSPNSVSSVVSVVNEEQQQLATEEGTEDKIKLPQQSSVELAAIQEENTQQAEKGESSEASKPSAESSRPTSRKSSSASLLEAAANMVSSLENLVSQSSPKARRKLTLAKLGSTSEWLSSIPSDILGSNATNNPQQQHPLVKKSSLERRTPGEKIFLGDVKKYQQKGPDAKWPSSMTEDSPPSQNEASLPPPRPPPPFLSQDSATSAVSDLNFKLLEEMEEGDSLFDSLENLSSRQHPSRNPSVDSSSVRMSSSSIRGGESFESWSSAKSSLTNSSSHHKTSLPTTIPLPGTSAGASCSSGPPGPLQHTSRSGIPPGNCRLRYQHQGSSKSSSAAGEDTDADNSTAITYHRYYHVFREGELDKLIEKYVQNLHIISSYYDHANWCIIAEKVQVWTI